jgi:hypothetical protein
MESLISSIALAAISFPLAFFLARSCLRGILKLLMGGARRDVL